MVATSEPLIASIIYNGSRISMFARLAQNNSFDFHHHHHVSRKYSHFSDEEIEAPKVHMLQDIQLLEKSLGFGFCRSKPPLV